MYDTSFINDESGSAAVAALADAISGREILSPVSGGTAFAVRDRVTQKIPLAELRQPFVDRIEKAIQREPF